MGIADGTMCVYCGGSGQVDVREIRCAACRRRLATIHGPRAQWLVPMPAELRRRVDAETARWDTWAARAEGRRPVETDIRGWLSGSRVYRPLLKAFPELTSLTGKRVLDIGGTCMDAPKFLRSGVARVDQLEVSPASQAVAMANLRRDWPAWEGRVWFHTAAAEWLPFADNTFDVVFSRSTVHHTDRRRVFPEIARVLRPGGVMLLIESYRSWPLYRLTSLRRAALRADRGTDDPLTLGELRALDGCWRDVTVFPFGAVWTIWSQTGDKLTRRPRHLVWAIDLKLGRLGGRALGSQCWVAARTCA